jgi:hypothetical protein
LTVMSDNDIADFRPVSPRVTGEAMLGFIAPPPRIITHVFGYDGVVGGGCLRASRPADS